MRESVAELVLDPDIDPWERQPAETLKRYSQFRTYLDMSRMRTVRAAAEQLSVSYGHMRNVSAVMLWAKRADAWDTHRDQLFEATWIEERRKAAENDAKILSAILAKVAARLASLKPEDLSPADVARLVDIAMRHRRTLFGDGPEITVGSGTKIRYEVVGVPDLSALH
jgi:hypothetical protein